MGCNCGGSFNIQQSDGLVEAPIVGDASYFHTGPSVTSENAENALVAPNGTPVWDPDTGTQETT